MRSKTILAEVVVSMFIAGATASSAFAAPPKDACSLLTKAQVSAAVGATIGEGQHPTPTYTKQCVWTPPGGSMEEVGNVMLDVDDAAGWAMGKMMMEQVSKNPKKKPGDMDMTPVSGVGDEAFYSIVGSNYAKLVVKRGNVELQIVVNGKFTREKREAIEKALALRVISKL
jgi:hypothetical protein